MADLVVQFERVSANYPCGLCGKWTSPEEVRAWRWPPPWPRCVASAAKKHAPPLAALIALADAAEHVGRIGRHLISPPLPALLNLARAAEDYLHTRPSGQRGDLNAFRHSIGQPFLSALGQFLESTRFARRAAIRQKARRVLSLRVAAIAHEGVRREPVDNESVLPRTHSKDDSRIGFLGVFAFPVMESGVRRQRVRDDVWLSVFLVAAGTLRVALLLAADYQQLAIGPSFRLLLASRLIFILVSAWTLITLRQAAQPAVVDRLFFAWGFLIVAMTVHALAARPPSDHGLLLMSFSMIVVGYCVTPLRLSQQATLALTYSAAALYVCRRHDGVTLSAVAATYACAHVFGAVMSWRLNHRRREMFLGCLRKAELRTSLKSALAEVRTLRGMLCMCRGANGSATKEQRGSGLRTTCKAGPTPPSATESVRNA